MFRKTLVCPVLLLLVLLTAGCNGPASQDASTSPKIGLKLQGSLPSDSDNSRTAQKTMQITTYQATKDALYLAPEIHVVPINVHPAQTALELLIAGPSNPEFISVVPLGTKVLSVNVKNHIAYVDFNDQLIKNNPGGSTEEMLLVAAIVNTLTEFSEIQKVQILVNGKKVDTISGHMDTSKPLSRSDEIIQK